MDTLSETLRQENLPSLRVACWQNKVQCNIMTTQDRQVFHG